MRGNEQPGLGPSSIQLKTTKTVNFHSGASIEIEYELSLVPVTNSFALFDNEDSAGVQATLKVNLAVAMRSRDYDLASVQVGLIENVLSSTRKFSYNSSKRSMRVASIPTQHLDGGHGSWAEEPRRLAVLEDDSGMETASGNIVVVDQPPAIASLVDDNAEDEGETLSRLDGTDFYGFWAAIQPGQEAIRPLNPCTVFVLKWDVQYTDTGVVNHSTVEKFGEMPSWEAKVNGPHANSSTIYSWSTW